MDWARFAQQMASMARDLLAQESVDATLERITHSATELVEGCDSAGILVLHGDKVQTLAPTDDLVVASDRIQAELREGPCFDAARARTGERLYRIHDFTTDTGRWPRFASRAVEIGVGSMMGFLLYTEDEDLGALNLYSSEPGAFTEASELAGWLLASHAAIAFSSARTHAQMAEAVATRHVIGEAMGLLMGRHGLDETRAFDVLRRYSQENNVKLREVARLVCEKGALT
ncbi:MULTISPECIES: GAF and ANTAR domain-containing protein [Streptomyces]|uniref:GAF and ANTAR domain-containing protein n=1 Tax=Streptomyces TaxID=1883 RepID=UPI000747D545|nr:MULTISPECIES: GAF and ANTAR domain-containing protein [Streptomyces]KUL69149.1 antitermination regulator [Streptomyces sp. NRRL WC-3605]KUL80330.1 antitermination regulator [Streptomyces sp. NRRL WC-3604]